MHQNLSMKNKPLAIVVALTGMSTAATGETSVNQLAEQNQNIEMIKVIGQATGGLDYLLSSEDIDKLQARTVGDLFKVDATISAGGPVGLGQKIYLRNIGEDALNISIDGAEVAAGIFHHTGRVLIEPELLKQVEIEAGTGTATAGPGSLGGAVRFTTKDPADLLRDSQNVGALLKSTYFSNGDGLKNSVSLYGRDDADIFSGLVSFIQSDHDDMDDANGDLLTGTGADRQLGYVKLVANVSEQQYLSLSYEMLEEEGDIHLRPEWIGGPRNPLVPIEGTRDTLTFNYGYDAIENDLLNISVNVYQTKSEQFRVSEDVLGTVETVGTTIKNTSVMGNHKLIAGINYRDDQGDLKYPYFSETYPGGDSESGEVKGVFVQDIIEVSEQLTVAAGLRFDDYEMTDWQDNEYSDNGVSPNISANYQLTERLHLSAGYSEAIRGVEIVDTYRIEAYFNSPDLKAQEAENIEVGLDYYGDNFNVAFGAYQTDIDYSFAHQYVGRALNVINLEDTLETDGYYLNVDYHFGNLTVNASFHTADTEADGEMATRYEYGSNANSIGDTLALTLDYAITENLQMGWISEYVKGIHDINIEAYGEEITTDKPGYGTHDVYLKWGGLMQDRLLLSLTVKNVFDKQYLSHASTADWTQNPGYDMVRGHYEPGRDIYVSASFKF